jgi:hypothetical protein
MKPKPQYLPPRQTVIYGYTRRMLDETSMNAQSFSMSVAEIYISQTAPDVRHVPFTLSDDLGHSMKNNAQTLRRYMDGTVKVLPADLEDAWLMALPEPYRSNCERDLARRRGLLPIKVGDVDAPAGQVASVATLTKEFGDLLCALAPALHEGAFTAADRVYAKRIINEADDVITAVVSMRRAIASILPDSANVR